MASLGELTATVRADISGYVTPMKQVVAVNRQVATSVQQNTGAALNTMRGHLRLVGRGSAETASGLSRLGQVSATVAAQAAGLGGGLGRLAVTLGSLAGGGGIVLAVGAAMTALVAVFRSANEESEKHAETIKGLAQAYDDLSGATARANVALAQQAVAKANSETSLGITSTRNRFGIPVPGIGQVRNMEAVVEANKALLAAEKALADFNAGRATKALQAREEAQRALTRAQEAFVNALKDGLKLDTPTNTDKKVSALTKEAQAWRAVKAEIVATTEAERRRSEELPEDITKAKGNDVKATFLGQQEQAIQGARDAAGTLARAFTSAFSDHQGTIMERVASVLKQAMMEAMEKLLAQKIFEGFLAVITGGGSKGLPIVGGIVENIFGAPPAMASGGGSVTVDLSGIPQPLGPIEMARDTMWQGVLVESLRQANSNGVRVTARRR